MLELEAAIKEAFGMDIKLLVHNNEIKILNLKSELDELRIFLFIHGYLYGVKNKNKDTCIKLYNPEAM